MSPPPASADPSSEFARVAVQFGVLTADDLAKCQDLHRREQQRGAVADASGSPPAARPSSLEDIVVREGYLNHEQVRAVSKAVQRLTQQARKVQDLKIEGYELLAVLGEGGLGTVYKGRQVRMNRMVALKVLHKQWVDDEEFRKRFLLEARIVGKMSHQNLVQVYDVGKADGHYYFSMEYLDNQTVEEQIAAAGRLPVAQAVEYAIQVTRALKYIREFGLVHRDIKPSNMLLGHQGVVKLGDFGFVQSHLDKELGYDDMVLGTPDYIAPEQALGQPVDFRADIYSLGASLYHMLTGRPPFSGSSSTVMQKHVREEVPSPLEIVPELPEDVVAVLERMMAKKPEDRYPDFEALFADLERVRYGQAPQTERLDAGKSAIVRVLKHERGRLGQLEQRLETLETEKRALAREGEQLRRALWLAAGAAGAGLLAAAVMLVLLLVRG